ncbi:S1C family serine protease [Legionella dresdenensis]|uniref:S1C family serine protease n=1 Tax=Legionella dresdenensis TaxID=450200 RepID=A0ABV8CC11_9GAMM
MKMRLLASVFACLISLPALAANLDELLPNERNTVEIFQKFSPKVVYVHRLATVVRQYNKMHVTAGAGSGIIWDDKGHIVTNFHVINGAEELAVSIGKITVPARVVGAEPRKDLAVLAITDPKALEQLKSFVPFQLIHTKDLLVGQKTIAIGNPFGLDHSLTVGIISALGRQVPGVGGVTIREMIQTDASINPGNSGGPLLDSKGRLIGLNTAIYSNSGSSAGIGFAVPADDIERIVPQLIKNGRIILAGIGIQRVDPSSAASLGVKSGILIANVIPKTPAATVGLRGTHRDQWGRILLGDIIVAINGHPVENYDVLYNLLTDIKVGEQITVTIKRNGKQINYKMKTIDIAAY